MKMNREKWKCVLTAVFPVLVVALIGSLLADQKSPWYLALNKPALQPPPVVFPIAWAISYVLIAITLYFSCREGMLAADRKLTVLYILSAVLNLAWTAVFFQFHQPTVAFFIILVYFIVSLLLFFELDKVNRWVKYLLLPYLGWLFFASIINYMIVMIN